MLARLRGPSRRGPLRLTLLGALLLALLLALPARRGSAQLAFERISQDRGLSNGTVTAIVQDAAGFLWLGTEDGLDRYDGAGFTVFRPLGGDSTTLADAWVTGLALGRDGGLW